MVCRCEHITVKFQQRDLETASDWDTLTPGNTAEYAWDEPMAAHRLRVVLESATEAFRDAPVQEYNLDDIKVAVYTNAFCDVDMHYGLVLLLQPLGVWSPLNAVKTAGTLGKLWQVDSKAQLIVYIKHDSCKLDRHTPEAP